MSRFALVMAVALALAACGSSSDEAERSIYSGRQAFWQRDFRGALQHFRTAVKRAPTNALAHAWRGYVAEVLGEAEEALEAYKAAVRINPSGINTYRLGRLAGELGETTLSVDWLRANLSISWTSRVRESVQDGFTDFTSCLTASPNISVLRTLACVIESVTRSVSDFLVYRPVYVAQDLFTVLVESGDHTDALDLARMRGWLREGVDYCMESKSLRISERTAALLAMLIHPTRADCLLATGKRLTENADYRLARFVLLELIRNSQDSEIRRKAQVFVHHRLPSDDISKRAEWLYGAGTVLYQRYDKFEEAIEVYKKAITADGSFSQPYYRIGAVYRHQGKAAEAMEWYRKAVAINPNHWRAHREMGWILEEQGRYQESLIALRKALALNPEDHYSQYKVAWVLSQLRRWEEALVAYRQAIALDPKDPYSHWGLSWVSKNLGQEEEARKEWQKALELDPNLQKKAKKSS